MRSGAVDGAARWTPWLVVIALAIGVAGAIYFWPRSIPQIGVDEEVFNTVDALFTAVNSHDRPRLADCEKRLRGFREAGTLPTEAAAELDAVIALSHSGQWEPAATKLYDFMLRQRRESPAAAK